MDGVIADFSKAIKTHPKSNLKLYQEDPDNIPGIFEHLELVPGAKDVIHQLHLSKKYDLFNLCKIWIKGYKKQEYSKNKK